MNQSQNEQIPYLVVMNHEEQYSIWRANMALPLGWDPTGFRGSQEECLSNIAEVWTDMTPASIRRTLSKDPKPGA